MAAYAGMQTVHAVEMDLGEFLEMRNWAPGENDDLETAQGRGCDGACQAIHPLHRLWQHHPDDED